MTEKSPELEIVTPRGMFGPGKDYLVDSVIRAVAESHATDDTPWPAKYGVEAENEVFSMRPFCWCDMDECPWCGPENRPNFHYKPLDFRVWWYKYIGRGTEMNRQLSTQECARMLSDCLPSSGNPTTTPPHAV